MTRHFIASLRTVLIVAPFGLFAQRAAAPADTTPRSPFTTEAFGGLRARNVGPAMTSGRIGALDVHPNNPAIIYVGASSGNLWKTVNGGATWQPIMDREGAYAIGWITIDRRNPNIVWVGTGENNSQRSVAYGDGSSLHVNLIIAKLTSNRLTMVADEAYQTRKSRMMPRIAAPPW